MTDRFDNFTEHARKVLTLAQEEAQRFNHNYIGTEHLLLGLVREGDGVAAKVLANMGVELNKVRSAVEFIIGRGDRMVMGEIGLTPRAKKVIELAVDEARRLNHHYIGTEHLLLGLVREGEGIAAGVLESLGVSLHKVRAHTIHVLGQRSSSSTFDARQATRPSTFDAGQIGRTPLIDQMGRDLTAEARAGKLDPAVGVEKEIERLVQILDRPTKTNPVLIDGSGPVRTAIVEELARRMVSADVPQALREKRLVALDVGMLAIGKSMPGVYELRLRLVAEEARRPTGGIILFIDEMHLLLGAGTEDAAILVKALLATDELACIGATTPDEYRARIEGDAALAPRFEPVQVDEPSIEETVAILRGIKDRYEEHHRLEITDEALQAAAELAARRFPERFLPIAAIDLIDQSAALVRLQQTGQSISLKEATRTLEGFRRALVAIQAEKESAITSQQYELAAQHRDREVELRRMIERLERPLPNLQEGDRPKLSAEDVAKVVALLASQQQSD